MEKSPDAYRTIAEVAMELNVPRHVLRFWETRFSELQPLKRGGGRRYYRPEDVFFLRRIYKLLYQEGYTIKGAKRLLEGKKTDFLKARGDTERKTQIFNEAQEYEAQEYEAKEYGVQEYGVQEYEAKDIGLSRKTLESEELQALSQELKACRELIARALAFESSEKTF